MRIFATLGLLAALGLQACSQTALPTTPPVQGARDTYLFSWAMYAEPVFDRDVQTFGRAYSQAFGAPAAARSFGFTSPRLEAPEGQVMQSALSSLAAQAVDGEDTVVVMLTSHGAPDVLALRPSPDGETTAFPADALAGFLAPLANDQQIIIIQACFSGSLIDDLRAPNRIILTAAAADRSSFGCNPDNDNTFFIRALNQALGQGGSWEQIFATTQAIVTQMEAEAGLPASNPQSFVGSQMRSLWSAQPS